MTIYIAEDDITHPIDLLADRLLSKQTVEMMDRYPDPKSMFQALRRAKDEHSDILREIFGEPSRVVA